LSVACFVAVTDVQPEIRPECYAENAEIFGDRGDLPPYRVHTNAAKLPVESRTRAGAKTDHIRSASLVAGSGSRKTIPASNGSSPSMSKPVVGQLSVFEKRDAWPLAWLSG
jgi:hypothetical protein